MSEGKRTDQKVCLDLRLQSARFYLCTSLSCDTLFDALSATEMYVKVVNRLAQVFLDEMSYSTYINRLFPLTGPHQQDKSGANLSEIINHLKRTQSNPNYSRVSVLEA
jgi:uncharacterized protein YciW